MSGVSIEVQLEGASRRILEQLAHEIVDEIRTNPHTPYDTERHRPGTPHLRDSFRPVESPRGYDILAGVPYWAYVEYGHRTRASRQPEHVRRWVPSQPYLRPAIYVVLARFRQEHQQ